MSRETHTSIIHYISKFLYTNVRTAFLQVDIEVTNDIHGLLFSKLLCQIFPFIINISKLPPGAGFTKGLSLDLDLKLRLLSLILAKFVVLDLEDFTKLQSLRLG